MFDYELHQLRSADLRRRAEHERLVRAALRGGRTARRPAGPETSEAESHTGRSRRHRFTRAA
ncbi:hypothetical protein ACF1A5_21475 [Streptomyces sp. NPDC014864]|uniref:hypothetical protein n=1 Tax=Streptomyces sp. NPDC014864 TaxID=3364924 RepID=UPI0036F92730